MRHSLILNAIFASLLLLPAVLCLAFAARAESPRQPIIDMHLHAYRVEFAAGAAVCPGDQHTLIAPIDPKEDFDPSKIMACPRPFHAPADDAELRDRSLAMLVRYNIRRAVTSGAPAEVAAWLLAQGK